MDVELAADEIERVGIGAEGEDGGEDGEEGDAMHGGCWCVWVPEFPRKIDRCPEVCIRDLEREKNLWWLRILTVGGDASYDDLVDGG